MVLILISFFFLHYSCSTLSFLTNFVVVQSPISFRYYKILYQFGHLINSIFYLKSALLSTLEITKEKTQSFSLGKKMESLLVSSQGALIPDLKLLYNYNRTA